MVNSRLKAKPAFSFSTSLLVTAIAGVMSVAQAADPAGTLDKTFGAGSGDGTPDGIVSTSLGKGKDYGKSVVVQADGKIIVAGDHKVGATNDISVIRYNHDGTLDSTFGVGNDDGTPDGIVSISIGNGKDYGKAVALQADGKIVVVGDHTVGKTSDITALRLNTDGTLDSTFGAGNDDGTPDGIVSISVGKGKDYGNSVAIQQNGKIVIGGDHTVGKTSDLVVARLNTDGTLDATFGNNDSDGTPDGIVSVSLGDGKDYGKSVAIQQDGKIVLAGDHTVGKTSDISVTRLLTDGNLDSTFGAGNSDGTPDGSVSISLGDGKDYGNSVAIQQDGKIVVGGDHTVKNTRDLTVLRLNNDGSLDSTFGQGNGDGTPDGIVSVSLGDGKDYGQSVAIQEDGKIVLGGYHTIGSNNADLSVTRFNTDGSLDLSFATCNDEGVAGGGTAFISSGPGKDFGNAIAIDPDGDGDIVIAGQHAVKTTYDILVARLLAK